MAARTWVPLDMPISLAEGHIRSSEFTINLDAGFGIFIEESRIFNSDAADCLIGFGDQILPEQPRASAAGLLDSGGFRQRWSRRLDGCLQGMARRDDFAGPRIG